MLKSVDNANKAAESIIDAIQFFLTENKLQGAVHNEELF